MSVEDAGTPQQRSESPSLTERFLKPHVFFLIGGSTILGLMAGAVEDFGARQWLTFGAVACILIEVYLQVMDTNWYMASRKLQRRSLGILLCSFVAFLLFFGGRHFLQHRGAVAEALRLKKEADQREFDRQDKIRIAANQKVADERRRAEELKVQLTVAESDELRRQEAEFKGVIKPGIGERPLPRSGERIIGPALIFGNSFTVPSGDDFALLTDRSGVEVLSIKITPEGLLVSGIFHNSEGKLLGRIKENQYVFDQDELLEVDNEGRSDRLVVYGNDAVGADARVVLDVTFINQNTVKILSDFYTQDGMPVYIQEEIQKIGGSTFSGSVFIHVPGLIKVVQ